MTHSQRRLNHEPVGGTLLCRACHLTVFKLLVQLAPPRPPPTTSSHLMQRHVTKNKLGVSALECALHKQTWSRATQSACRTILGWMIQIGGRMLLQQIAKIQIHRSGAIFFRQFWRDFTDSWSWSLPSSPTTAENTFKWLISNQNATNKFQCVTSLKRTKGYF